MVRKLSDFNTLIMKLWGKTVAIENLYGDWSTQFISTLFLGISFSLCAIQVINSDFVFTIGSLVAYITYLPKFQNLINEISSTNFKFNKQFSEHEKTFEYLSLPNEYVNDEKDNMQTIEGPIEFENVIFKYPNANKPILNELSFEAKRGSILFIIGPSGAGKSTIFDLLLRMYYVNDGYIKINGKNINSIPLQSLRKTYPLLLKI